MKIKGKQKLPGNGIKVASYFSGAGGLDLGFHQLGFDILFATDIEKVFCDTINLNKGGYVSKNTNIINEDIRSIKPTCLVEKIDLVIGGPPCQSFSASGRRAGGAAGRLDGRGSLFEAYCKHIEYLKPKAFVFENVRGIMGTNRGEDWKAVVKAFSDIGYKLSYRILDACDYGIPQHRERLFLVGHLSDEEFLFPLPTVGPDSPDNLPYVSPKKAFSLIDYRGENVDPLILRDGKYSDLLKFVPPGDNYLYFTAKRGYPKPIFAYRSRFSDFLYKANPDYPVKTIIANPGKYTGPLHWDNRYFTISEYKAIQGFPADYKFVGSRNEIIRQIGNSVSPRLSIELAKAVAKQIFSRNVEVELLASDRKLSFDKRKGSKAQKTKEYHKIIMQNNHNGDDERFKFESYETIIHPNKFSKKVNNMKATMHAGNLVKLIVRGDSTKRLFAKMTLVIHFDKSSIFYQIGEAHDAKLDVTIYGSAPECIQTMWNAVDDWVIRSSNFHSLIELYGHFTEPHPIFEITEFKVFSKHPIAEFGKHVSNFSNCSRYFNKKHLVELFGDSFGTLKYIELVNILRGYRFDIRSNEINIAMPKGVYMVSYPFTLPYRKQMNFSVKKRLPVGSAESYINFVRAN